MLNPRSFRLIALTSLFAFAIFAGCKKKAPAEPDAASTPVAAPSPVPVTPAAMTPVAPALALVPGKRMAKDLDALPMLAQADTPALQQVNASLKKLNDATKSYAAQCGAGGSYDQSISPTMLGPGYLSIEIGGSQDCGGAHPNTYTSVELFDLSTGKAVDWTKLVHGPGVTTYADTNADGNDGAPKALVSPALLKLYVSDPKFDKANCKDAMQDPQSFLVWPEAKSGTLIVEAFDLPFATAACANDMTLTLDQAKALGFDQSFLAAVASAHQQSGAEKLASAGH